MVGAITSWDVLFHPVATVHCFGWQVFLRALSPWHETTFLSLLREANFFGAATSPFTGVLERCIDLELRAERIYSAFAQQFDQPERIRRFFASLAAQEQEHADLLEVCRVLAARGNWNVEPVHAWRDRVGHLEQQMQGAETSLRSIENVNDALQVVIEIESSEINQIFQVIVAAADSPFIARLRPFRRAMEAHLAYICRQMPKLAPPLAPACRELMAKFSR
ncbi:MAG: hypothetical protein JW719_00725 [Pirellulales bacterium]|nr:hypothetical protein [Pirellulales bacterium]